MRSSDAASADRKPGTAPQRVAGRVGADVLAAGMAEARALVAVDMGTPREGDHGTALLDFLGASPDQDVHLVVYGPAYTEGLSDDQKANRKRFNDLCTKLLDAFVQDR
ncbi:hypothetical protein [Nocardia terpenica]|uniref:hypothetical protein n=1 Tax=Nocardia terpenica TaxID=455432 RepID=UPI0012FE59B7|nr:hypothetical protein [Nocardia terpenica]